MAKKFQINSALVPEGAKLKNGEDFNASMTGAYYGSSFEWSISAQIQYCNGEDRRCPAEQKLLDICKPKHQHGEFGALKDEVQNIGPSREINRNIVELTSVEEVTSLADNLSGWSKGLHRQLPYYEGFIDGKRQAISADELMGWFKSRQEANALIQAEKTEYLKECGLEPTFNGRRWVSPKYSDSVLKELAKMNKKVSSPTGVNLIINISGIHTIARDEKFYTGSLDQNQLDELARKLDYSEHPSFYKGVVKRGRIAIPIQTVYQLNTLMKQLELANGLCYYKWPDKVKSSTVHCTRA